jgi:cobalt-precorrin-5B (C1)-methyltransferase
MTGFSYKYGKKLRKGYTTGTAAAAAAEAAVSALIKGSAPRYVDVILPSENKLRIYINESVIRNNYTICYVKVDGGDDHNVLNGCRVYATARLSDKFEITAGEGIGVVTRKGLQVPVGQPAINPVPMKMIETAAKKAAGETFVSLEISVEDGEELAKKTLNEKLGIVGGISIIGTTGIVEPMSSQGFIDSMITEIDMMLLETKSIVIVPGNYGYDFAKNTLGIDERKIVKVSNYVGEALFYLKNKSVKNILLVGHLGKFVKLAGGNFNTHSYVSDSKMEIIASAVITLRKNADFAIKILECNTTDEACDLLKANKMLDVFDYLCERALDRINQVIKMGSIPVAIGLFNTQKEMMGKSIDFMKMVGEIND